MDIKEIKEYLGSDWTAVQECINDVLHSDISEAEAVVSPAKRW